MLRDLTFYMPMSNKEKAAVYAAMSRDSGAQAIGTTAPMDTPLR
jgi:hypothetical protein